jgi:primosomal protein N' (replication factor Y)
MWHVGHPGVFAVLEESRRAMKDRQTPTVAVRDVVLERARRLRVPALFAGPTPSLDLMARRPRVVRGPGRVWPLVEVVDRHEDPPGGGLLAERTRQAIRITVNSGGAVFLFAHRRGYSAASRCASCRALRKCRSCGSRPDPGTECRRCGAVLGPCDSCGGARFEPLGAGVGRIVDEATRITGRGKTAEYPTTAPVMVGTERDLSDLEPMDLIVMVDADGLVFGTNYRAAEEALRIGARLAGRLRTGSGRRLIVQTNEPDNAVVAALRRGDPLDFGVVELVQRTRFGYPPAADLIVLEAKGGPPDLVDSELRKVARRAQVHGPAPADGANRWLIQGKIDLDTRRAFRPVLQRLRDSGFSLRVDVDPIDL